MATLIQDVRYALRMLAKSPVLTGSAYLTLALGIGANTAIFSIVEGLLLRQLPVPNPNQIMLLAGHLPGNTIGVTNSPTRNCKTCASKLRRSRTSLRGRSTSVD